MCRPPENMEDKLKNMTFLERQKYYPFCIREYRGLLDELAIAFQKKHKLPYFGIYTTIRDYEWCKTKEEEMSLFNIRMKEYRETATGEWYQDMLDHNKKYGG